MVKNIDEQITFKYVMIYLDIKKESSIFENF